MSTSQLITISPDGSIQGLQMHRGKGLDLRQFGNASIVRSTEIEWSEEHQKWWIHFQQGKRKDTAYTVGDFDAYDPSPLHTLIGPGNDYNNPLYFDDYDDAVKVEIEIIQAMRKCYGKDYV